MYKFLDKLFLKRSNHKNKQDESDVQEMIKGIHRLETQVAKDVMVPRVDLIAVDDVLSTSEIFSLIINSSFSRFPVFHGTIDNVIGLIYVKDMLKSSQDMDNFDLSTTIKKPFFVTETMRLDILLREMKKRRIHMALVVDEYGGISGAVCLEDIIEEIVGEIQDEFDNDDEEFIKISNNVYLVDARFPISKFNELLSLHLPDEEIDTIGGFVYSIFGKIPVCYEKVNYQALDFIIQTMVGNKIKSVKVVVQD